MKQRDSDDLDSHIGYEIREARLNSRLTQRDVASKLGISGTQWGKYENGTDRICASRLYRFCKIVKVKIGDIFRNYME